jgi:dihydroxyacid dehydratase/phosphogluconate dehydratase
MNWLRLKETPVLPAGSCAGMFTANSMNCLTEHCGMGLRVLALYHQFIRLRIRQAKQVA